MSGVTSNVVRSARPSASETARMTITLRDVARAAEVSVATASRALDPQSRHVSAPVRERVVRAAQEMGYRPNTSARATTTGRTTMVAALVSDIREPFNAEIVHGVIERANLAGLVVTIAGTDHYFEDETRVVRMLRSMRPRAMVLTGARTGSSLARATLQEELKRYARDGGRVVVAGDDELPFDTAVLPRRRGAEMLVETLARRGYTAPAIVVPALDSVASQEWEAGVISGARAAGMHVEYSATVRAPLTRDGGFEAGRELLVSGPARFDVVLAATDMVALGVMGAIRDAGLRPGIDIGVAGFDNAIEADDVFPSLTSVDIALARAGAAAVELALQEAGSGRRVVELEPSVLLRDSTPPRTERSRH